MNKSHIIAPYIHDARYHTILSKNSQGREDIHLGSVELLAVVLQDLVVSLEGVVERGGGCARVEVGDIVIHGAVDSSQLWGRETDIVAHIYEALSAVRSTDLG